MEDFGIMRNIKDELFKTYETFRNEKSRIAQQEVEQIKLLLTSRGLNENIRIIKVGTEYEEDIFQSTDAILIEYKFELEDTNTVDHDTVKALDNYFIKKYGEENIKIRTVRMHLDFVDFEYLIRIDKERK